MISGRRPALRSWLAALLLAPGLGAAVSEAFAAAGPEAGCACAGGTCCRRAPERSCCPAGHSGPGACGKGARAGAGPGFSVGCGCEHPAPIGSVSAREQAALLRGAATIDPPRLVAAGFPHRPFLHGRTGRAPEPPPPRRLSSIARP